MALNRQDCIVFDFLQTPIWIIDRNQLWYANRSALNIGLNERDIADFTGYSTTECFYPIGGNIYQCSVSKITIEDERPAILVEACLDTRYNLLLEASPDAIMITDADTGTIVQVNNNALSLTKKQAKDLIGLHHSQLYSETQRQEADMAFQEKIGCWWTGWFIPRTDRPSVPVDIYSTLFVSGNRRYLYGFFRDQTETQRIEKEWHNALSQLEQREEQLRVALSGANVICWEYSPKTDRVQGIGTFSPSGWEMLSWEMTLDEALTMIYAPDISRLKSKVYDKFVGGGTFFEEIRLADFPQLPRWFLVSGEVLLDQAGETDRIVGITIEITAKKQVELELQSSRTMIESIMANMPSLVCIKDIHGKYTYVNDNALRTFNISREQVIGKTNREILSPDLSLTLDSLEYVDQQVISTQKSVQTELELVQNGIPRTYLYVKFPLFNEYQELQGIGGITTDITHLKQAESNVMQNQAYLNCLISIQQQLLVDDDRDHYPRILQQLGQTAKASRSYIFANHRSAEGILLSDQIYEWCTPGIKSEVDNPELQNLSLEEFFPRWIKHFEAGQEIIGNVEDFPASERQILEPKGILSILVFPLFVNHQFWGFIGFDNCKSTDPWSESVLGLLRSVASAISFHLERQENRRILIAERQKADAANAAKSRFLANMSHELRTPMNGVIGLTSLLQTTPLTDEQQDYVLTIRNSSETLLSLINDILDFSKIEAGRIDLEIQEFNLRNCVEEAIDLVAPQAGEKQLELLYWIAPDVPVWIRSDITRLRQILLNLLSNAIKFTHQGNIVVEVSVKEKINDQDIKILFQVTDEGIGIPADRLDQIFTPFTQADSSITRRYGGTGLGLSICYRLTQLLGGSMSVTSDLGRGSSFSFDIQTKIAEPLLTLPSLPSKKICLLLENPLLQRMISSMLLSWQMEVTEKTIEADLIITEELIPEPLPPQVLLLPYGQTSEHKLVLTKPVRYDSLFTILVELFASSLVNSQDISYTTDLIHLPLRILIAEDNIVNQKVCMKMLTKLNYQADLVANGLEVLEALERQSYDVILMDIQMPEMDGLTATKKVRQRWGARPWIIALTADAQSSTAQQSYDSGVNDYLTKPIRLEDLAIVLRHAYYQQNLTTP